MKNKSNLCRNCKTKPIYIQKQKQNLCLACYYSDYLAGRINNTNEIKFVKCFFKHNNWFYQPATFKLNGRSYTPDFYDAERNVFIEVSGTKQAYHANKEKYKLMRKWFPKINFEIRRSDGQEIDEDSRIDWQQAQPHESQHIAHRGCLSKRQGRHGA